MVGWWKTVCLKLQSPLASCQQHEDAGWKAQGGWAEPDGLSCCLHTPGPAQVQLPPSCAFLDICPLGVLCCVYLAYTAEQVKVDGSTLGTPYSGILSWCKLHGCKFLFGLTWIHLKTSQALYGHIQVQARWLVTVASSRLSAPSVIWRLKSQVSSIVL